MVDAGVSASPVEEEGIVSFVSFVGIVYTGVYIIGSRMYGMLWAR